MGKHWRYAGRNLVEADISDLFAYLYINVMD